MYLSNPVTYAYVEYFGISEGTALQPQLSDILALTSWKLGVTRLLSGIITPACFVWAKNTFFYFSAPAEDWVGGKIPP